MAPLKLKYFIELQNKVDVIHADYEDHIKPDHTKDYADDHEEEHADHTEGEVAKEGGLRHMIKHIYYHYLCDSMKYT